MPELSWLTSPRNLLITNPATSSRSSGVKSSTWPSRLANTPPRSMSPTSRTGERACSAMLMLTMSWPRRFTSAELPAPSMTTTSWDARRRPKAEVTTGQTSGWNAWYSGTVMCPTGSPITTTWLVASELGLSSTGFMSTCGSRPAARA